MLKKAIKKRIDKAYKDELTVKDYTPTITKKDAEITQLKQEKADLESQLKERFVIKKSTLKAFLLLGLCFCIFYVIVMEVFA